MWLLTTFVVPTFTPGRAQQELPQPLETPQLQAPWAALTFLGSCFAMAMRAAATMMPTDWQPYAALHCPTCTCSHHRAHRFSLTQALLWKSHSTGKRCPQSGKRLLFFSGPSAQETDFQPICRSRGTLRKPAWSYSGEYMEKGKQSLGEGRSHSNTALFAFQVKFKQPWLRAGPATSATHDISSGSFSQALGSTCWCHCDDTRAPQ